MKDRFNNFSELARYKKEGTDYRVISKSRSTGTILIIAPHGGTIEHHTSKIAAQIARKEYSLYIFQGLEKKDSFHQLHITSNNFDEPRCLEMISRAETVITIHGCTDQAPVIYLGGKDQKLKTRLSERFNAAGIRALTQGHRFPATSERNICNRGKTGGGVQIEFSRGIRKDRGAIEKCVEIIRAELAASSTPPALPKARRSAAARRHKGSKDA